MTGNSPTGQAGASSVSVYRDISTLLHFLGYSEGLITGLVACMRAEDARRQDAEDIDQLFRGQSPSPHPVCPHGFVFRWQCGTCLHFDEIEARAGPGEEARERYRLQSEQSTEIQQAGASSGQARGSPRP